MRSSKNIALRIALAIGALTFLLVYFSHSSLLVLDGLAKAIIIALLVLGVSFLLVLMYLEKFLLQRVKLIYKTINNFKRQKSSAKQTEQTDLLEEVNKDVMAWSEDKLGQIKELQTQENFRKEFIGNLSHELKTPLFTIQGYILTLLDGALDDPEHNELFLSKAAKSVDRMTALLEDLDTINSMEGGELPLDITQFDVVALTKEVFELLETPAKKNNIKLKFKASNQKPELVMADRDKITQVLTNLIVNSIKYGTKGGYTEVRFYDMDENVLIEIKDDGIGIAEEHLPRLFERFYRVDKSRSRHIGGTGLGLAITKHIIESHGQDISARSVVGKGSTFTFSLAKA